MNLGGLFDLETKKEKISQLEQQMAAPNFWDDQQAAQKVINETNRLKTQVNTFEEMMEHIDNAEVLYELVGEENDPDLLEELSQEINKLRHDINDFELEMLLSEPYDANNAILELHPGAGGTESQDWASILL